MIAQEKCKSKQILLRSLHLITLPQGLISSLGRQQHQLQSMMVFYQATKRQKKALCQTSKGCLARVLCVTLRHQKQARKIQEHYSKRLFTFHFLESSFLVWQLVLLQARKLFGYTAIKGQKFWMMRATITLCFHDISSFPHQQQDYLLQLGCSKPCGRMSFLIQEHFCGHSLSD